MSTESNLLQVRKPGTPTKRPTQSFANGAENKIFLGNTSVTLQPLKSPKKRKADKSATATQPRFSEIPEILPKHLRERLQTFRVPSADAILKKEGEAARKAKSYNEAKSKQAALRSAKVATARETKSQFSNNFSLLGSTEPSTKRTVKAVTLPTRLQKRLDILNEKIAAKVTPDNILKKESSVHAKKKKVIETKLTKLRSHNNLVKSRKTLKSTKKRYDVEDYAGFLPQHLIDRLNQYRVPVKAAILRKEERAAHRAAAVKAARVRQCALVSEKVKKARDVKKAYLENFTLIGGTQSGELRQNIDVELPGNLKQRLKALAKKFPKKSKEAILQKEIDAKLRFTSMLTAVAKSRKEHHKIVTSRMVNKATVERYTSVSDSLPESLRLRLQRYRAPTEAAIIRKEARASHRAKLCTAAKVTKANIHNMRVERVKETNKLYKKNFVLIGSTTPTEHRSISPVTIPLRLRTRLRTLKEKSKERREKEYLLAREDRAVAKRGEFLKKSVLKSKQHNGLVAKRMKSKFTKPRYEQIPDYLPEHLKQRLKSFRAPKAATMLRKASRVDKKYQLCLKKRQHLVKLHLLNVSDVIQQKKSFQENFSFKGESSPAKLPTRLQNRLSYLESKKATANSILEKESQVTQKRKAILKSRVSSRREHNIRVKSMMNAKFTKGRYEEIPEYLPDRLKQRLAEYRVPTADTIKRKLVRASTRRDNILKSRKQNLELHNIYVSDVIARKVEFSKNFSFTGNETPVKLPKRFQERLLEIDSKKSETEDILRKEKTAQENRQVFLKLRSEKASLSGQKAKKLFQAKKYEPRYQGNQIPEFLPENLKERLGSFRKPTTDRIQAKLYHANQKNNRVVESKKYLASAHSKHIEDVRVRNREMKGNMVLLGSLVPTENRIRSSVELPKHLLQRLERIKEKHHNHTPDKILKREEDAHLRRKEIQRNRVVKAKMHSSKVNRVLDEKRLEVGSREE